MTRASDHHAENERIGHYLVVLVVVLLFLITLIPTWASERFVPPTGNIKIGSVGFFTLLGLGLLCRVNWVRYLTAVLLAGTAWLVWDWIMNKLPLAFHDGYRNGEEWYLLLVMSVAGCAILLAAPRSTSISREAVTSPQPRRNGPASLHR